MLILMYMLDSDSDLKNRFDPPLQSFVEPIILECVGGEAGVGCVSDEELFQHPLNPPHIDHVSSFKGFRDVRPARELYPFWTTWMLGNKTLEVINLVVNSPVIPHVVILSFTYYASFNQINQGKLMYEESLYLEIMRIPVIWAYLPSSQLRFW